jgi:hypothetical protein
MPLGWRLVLSLSPTCAASEDWIYPNWIIQFGKPNTSIFLKTLDRAPTRSSLNRADEPRCGSLVILSEVLCVSSSNRADEPRRGSLLMLSEVLCVHAWTVPQYTCWIILFISDCLCWRFHYCFGYVLINVAMCSFDIAEDVAFLGRHCAGNSTVLES